MDELAKCECRRKGKKIEKARQRIEERSLESTYSRQSAKLAGVPQWEVPFPDLFGYESSLGIKNQLRVASEGNCGKEVPEQEQRNDEKQKNRNHEKKT